MRYKNTDTGRTASEIWLNATGYSSARARAIAGWLPVRDAKPAFSEYTHRLEPVGEPVLNADGQGFTQSWKAVELCGEELLEGLEKRRGLALSALERAFVEAEEEGQVLDADGVAYDANGRAKRDLDGLITIMEAGGEESATYCDAGNAFHELSLAELRELRLLIIRRGQALYARKWALRGRIEGAETVAEIEAVKIDFEVEQGF